MITLKELFTRIVRKEVDHVYVLANYAAAILELDATPEIDELGRIYFSVKDVLTGVYIWDEEEKKSFADTCWKKYDKYYPAKQDKFFTDIRALEDSSYYVDSMVKALLEKVE